MLVKFIENKNCLKNMFFKPISSTQHFLLQKNHLKFKIIVGLHRLLLLLCYVKQSQTKQMLNLINWLIKLNETAFKIWMRTDDENLQKFMMRCVIQPNEKESFEEYILCTIFTESRLNCCVGRTSKENTIAIRAIVNT